MAHDMHDTGSAVSADTVRGQISRLLEEFVKDTPGATDALLASRDGLPQVFCSHMEIGWVDQLAAAFSGMAALAKGVAGPMGAQLPARQVLIERDDALFLLTDAGTGHAFNKSGGTVPTVLVVLARTDANIGTIAYSVGRLIQNFAPFMTTPVRARHGQDGGGE
ncbi:putative regulator of Ras-like GTPase activity (Roadblock/LC7/MglB family) [Streptomyces sp. SLBN-115]|nr:putative regulator of Ras-like GTPase activity (Roadblock/LC7/MglB family) [Streptomyces sp. SLBN-115]